MLSIALLSLQALGRRRRVLVVVLLLAVPAALAVAYAAGESHPDGIRFAIELFDQLVLPVLLPLTALIFSTSALGGEVEDRTLIYLTLRPISRASIVIGKLLAAALLTAVLVALAIAVMYAIASTHTAGAPPDARDGSPLAALLLAGVAGSLAYCSIFLLVGLRVPRRGLVVGIIYVLVWEGIAAGLSTALATFSIRRYVQALLDSRLDSARLAAIQPINITGGTGLLVLVLIIAAGIAGTTMLLRRLELP